MDNVLYEAARLIDASGHCKKAFEISDNVQGTRRYCIEGAIRKVLFGEVDWSESSRFEILEPHLNRVARVINPDATCDPDTIYAYNDAPERTPEECVKVLMEAAEIGEENE